MTIQKIAGLVLIIGSIFFFIAAFSPISRVFTEPDAAKKLEIILGGRRPWTVSQLFFALGAIVTAAGLILTSFHFRELPAAQWLHLAAVVLAIGAGLWSWHVYLRTVDPHTFVEGSLPDWLFMAYTLFTQAGLAAAGAVLLRSEIPDWVGWVLIGGSLFFFVAFLIFKDMPPFVYYILTLLVGVVMYWNG